MMVPNTKESKVNPLANDAHDLLDNLVQLDPCTWSSQEETIGVRLRRLRRDQSLSIRSLAAKCGLSANTLSLIENGRTSPSVHTLQLLAQGLGIPVVSFFEEEKSGSALIYQQQGKRTRLQFTNGSLEKLSEGLPPLGSEPILVTLNPGPSDEKMISHTGREFIYCLEGKVVCEVAGQEYPLTPGDSLLFDASTPHRWLNAAPESSKLLVLFCPMEGHDQPAEKHLGY